ncbi:MAG: prolipoprotein diacylglyceryl transferase [Myxococcota bacterium]
MKPNLWRAPFDLPLLGELSFPSYSTLLALGLLIAIVLSMREAKRNAIDPNDFLDLNLWMIVWGLVGARVLHVIADGHFMDYVHMCTDPSRVPAIDPPVAHCTADAQCGDYFVCDEQKALCHPPRDCFVALAIWRGGLAYYGGFIFAALYAVRFVRRRGMPFWRSFDLGAPYIAMGLFFGRMGCYLNGCCYGKVAASALGIVFPRHSEPWRHQLDAGLIDRHDAMLPVYPTQLWQALANLATFVVLYYVVRRRKRFDGEVFAWLLILKAFTRSTIEIWRDDERGVFFGGAVSTSQLISIPLFVLALVLVTKLRARREAIAGY